MRKKKKRIKMNGQNAKSAKKQKKRKEKRHLHGGKMRIPKQIDMKNEQNNNNHNGAGIQREGVVRRNWRKRAKIVS